ncbi:hypothetical protein V6N11_007396 [Hibiscus sabdariffa]|uniref:Ubiquinol-cytochrome C reductase hinge domain-containing protein n=1 Tax=Hibiscus sabdariffa TaxID=183260 RepID=A0ABR1ZQQ1_9ROSI
MAGALYTPPLKLTLTLRGRDLVLLSFLKLGDLQLSFLLNGCKPKCVKQLRSYEACIKRIQGDESGHKHCTGQYFDYWSCVDKCVAPSLFLKLK